MNKIGFLLKVRQDRIEEYEKHREAVWPSALDALRRTGWRNYSLFLGDDGLLFGYFETPLDLEPAARDASREEMRAQWIEFMKPYFDNLGGRNPVGNVLELEEVFRLD